MKIIKVDNMEHEIFQRKSMPENNLEVFRFEEPDGYMVINRNKKVFSITINSVEELPLEEKLTEILTPYLTGHAHVTISTINTKLIDHFIISGQSYWYGMYSMHLENDVKAMKVGKLKGYEGKDEIYLDILGRCFEPMRRLHGFEPFDWYINNQDLAIKEFKAADKKGDFYSYELDGQLIGTAVIEDDEIDVLGILPEVQQNGYGAQFLRGILHDMRQTREHIKISVVESNQHVLRLYQREGFIIDEHNKIYKNY